MELPAFFVLRASRCHGCQYCTGSQVKSSQVKSSSNFMAAAPAAFGGEIGRAARRNWHGWRALSWGFIHIVFFLIDHRGAPGARSPTSCLFQASLLYGNANPIQADDGSDRGPAQGLSRWAKASIGSG